MEEEIQLESWESMKSRDFDILTSGKRKKQMFQSIGYDITASGDLIDKVSGKKVSEKDKVINLNESPKLAFISGSHNFVRTIAEYSDLLAKEGNLKFVFSEESSSKK